MCIRDRVSNESRWNGIRIRWLQQQVTHGLVKLLWIDGPSMLADVMTKSLPTTAFLTVRRQLMNLSRRFGFSERVTFSP